MKSEWKEVELGCILQTTETIDPTKTPDTEFFYIDVSCVDNQYFRIVEAKRIRGRDAPSRARKKIFTDDVIFATVRPTLKRIAIVPSQYNGQICSTGYFVFRPKPIILTKFLFYFLQTEGFIERMKALQKGASYPAVTDAQVREQLIRFPISLVEQQRIVALLDQAFTGIAMAKANAEKNLQNAKDLFSFYIDNIFSNPSESWKVIPLGEACTLQRGFDLPKRLRKSGDYPLISSSGVSDYIDDFKVNSPGVATGRSGSIGNVFFIETDFWPLNTVLYVKDFHGNYEQFIYYLLSHFGLNKYSTGAGVPTLNRNFVHNELVSIPGSFQEQVEIVTRIDNLFIQSKKLEAIFNQKITILEELKKSILYKAFNGELTEG